jgi:hypothetical protein
VFVKVLLLILYLVHVEGKYNPSDILTKALGWVNFQPLVQPLLFWKEETIIDKPFPMVIKETKYDPIFVLRGVTGITLKRACQVVHDGILPELILQLDHEV